MVLVFVDKPQCPTNHHLREVLTRSLDWRCSFIKIMKTGAVQEIVVIVVDESVTDTKEFVEALLLGAIVAVSAEMPFSVQCRSIPRRLKRFGKRHLFQCHVDPFGGVHITLRPIIDTAPLWMSAEAHDRAVALISHLPQLVAGGLLGAARERPTSLDLAAGSFRDLTRVGASQPIPWVEILKTNQVAVLDAIGALRDRLATIEAAIVSDDDTLLGLLSDARETRRSLGSPVAQVRVALADQPGELAKVGHAFEDSGVDIRDIQMRHSPHGGGGVLTLSVRPGEQGALRLALEDQGLLIIP